ncbi:alpha/beta fold hydrolase [Mycobacterium bourgelatii]|nr:alpha/beta fold hydrolase [Mycobacterium bourgelatii]MCV6978292.1 alpha/beta fold hydrolase [Mycobacterium bourgelatii]
MTTDHVLGLRDGRTLSYAEYGDRQGFPIINAHGGLACRLDVEAAAAMASERGVRLISPDRPGVGRSDPKPGRTIRDWASDVVELINALDIDRFAAMGWSLGGQYAAALACVLPARVTRVAIVAGMVPLTEPGAVEALPAIDRTYLKLSQRAPWLARQCLYATGFAAMCAPPLYGRLAARSLGAADAAVLRAQGYGTFARMSREALRQPGGVVEEYRAMVRPWGFELEDLQVPVDVWAGTEDQLLDAKWTQRLAERIPNATMHLVSGGHFLAHHHYPEIFESLKR